jgi:5-methylcytosine-specific restriction protein A
MMAPRKGLFVMRRPTQVLSQEFLTQKYIVEKLSMVDIGKMVDRDPKTILFWMRKYGIPRRPRGFDVKQQFKKGQESWMKGKHHSEETKEKLRQADLAMGKVPYLKNGVHWLKGKHGADTPSWKGGTTPERQLFYSSLEWKAAFSSVWERDKGICQRCGTSSNEPSDYQNRFHVHHIASFDRAKELRADPNNLVILCLKCHRFVHSKKNTKGEFIKK